jgi:hypothetical protein
MNVFVLSPGRCGTMTLTYACKHMTNFRAGHETNVRCIGAARLAYPDNFIEIDNRLSWILGRLDERFGDEARYVHLTRDPEAIAQSYNKRWHIVVGIVPAYRTGIFKVPKETPIEVCRDYVETVNANIRSFLRDKTHVMQMALETIEPDFIKFWDWIGAEGNRGGALAELKIRRNQNIGESNI